MAKIKVDDLIYDNGGTDTTVDLTTAFDDLGKLVKIHHFDYSTRTQGSSSANNNQFTWTSSFSPVDATNNNFIFWCSAPVNSADQDFAGYGLRVGNVDFQGYGNQYSDNDGGMMSDYALHFRVGGGTLATTANQTIYMRLYTTSSHPDQWFPNSSDDNRLGAQTRGYLTIWEYKS